jgi:hypothetical protein
MLSAVHDTAAQTDIQKLQHTCVFIRNTNTAKNTDKNIQKQVYPRLFAPCCRNSFVLLHYNACGLKQVNLPAV